MVTLVIYQISTNHLKQFTNYSQFERCHMHCKKICIKRNVLIVFYPETGILHFMEDSDEKSILSMYSVYTNSKNNLLLYISFHFAIKVLEFQWKSS